MCCNDISIKESLSKILPCLPRLPLKKKYLSSIWGRTPQTTDPLGNICMARYHYRYCRPSEEKWDIFIIKVKWLERKKEVIAKPWGCSLISLQQFRFQVTSKHIVGNFLLCSLYAFALVCFFFLSWPPLLCCCLLPQACPSPLTLALTYL